MTEMTAVKWTPANLAVENALRCARDARRALLAIYLPDPDDEVAAAETPRPVFLAAAMDAVHATVENLMNALDR